MKKLVSVFVIFSLVLSMLILSVESAASDPFQMACGCKKKKRNSERETISFVFS